MHTPPPDTREPRGLVLAATTCAVVVLASQLAGKAARDAIFLEQFAVRSLPLLLAVSSALSIGFTFLFARTLRRGIPVRVVQFANVISAALMIVEWIALPHAPRGVAVVIYMHQTLIGPILVSGFWSVVSECFDPRTARRVLGTVGTGATIGALVGAVLAERVAHLVGTEILLPTIAGLQLIAVWRLSRVRGNCVVKTDEDHPVLKEALHNITKVSLLQRLAIVTVIVTIAAALLDYVFKAMATQVVHNADDLTRLFAMFHGVVGILTALLQWILGRWALQHLGLARTLATLPGAVIVFGIIAVLIPGIGTYVALRGAENVLRNSLYREAYEVFYTPLLAAERRATKTIIDVGVERFGDVLGGLAVLAIIALVPAATSTLLMTAIALSAVGMIVALKAQQSYVEALERSLLAHAIDLEGEEPRDRTTRATFEMVAQRASGSYPRSSDAKPSKSARWSMFRGKPKPPPPVGSLDVARIGEIASGDARRVRQALEESPLSPAGVAYAIAQLDKPAVSEAATRAINRVAGSCLGQIADAVRDPGLPVSVRRVLPAIMALASTDRSRAEIARAGLLASLADPELEVRASVAEALSKLRELHPELAFEEALIFEGVRRELTDSMSPEAISHLATLLALALPADAIRTAFVGLKSDDPALRGVALEYLENILPEDIRNQMWAVLAVEPPAAVEKRPLEDVIAELLRPRRASSRNEAEEEMHATQIDLPVARVTPVAHPAKGAPKA